MDSQDGIFEEEAGGLVYLGALRPRLFFYVDKRIWGIVAALVLLGIPASRGGPVYVMALWGVALALIFVGAVCGIRSDYLVDELIRYVEWRVVNFGSGREVPDEPNFTAIEPRDAKRWRP